jgi:hypothetical protein
MWYGVWPQTPYHTAFGNSTPAWVLGTVVSQTSCDTTVGLNSFSKNCNFFMDSDGDKIYIKIVVFDEIYNFVVKAFFI